ncbi:MAG TPA: hypothetical protein VM029_01895, partial [Opitutaceae bacterium]|nr:hypothetical protein [Opitutaceae bacterium]
MNTVFSSRALRGVAVVVLTANMLCPRAIAQAAPTPPEVARYDANKNGRLDPHELAQLEAARRGVNPPSDETVQLNVFEVSADRDDSYGALNSNSITRFNTELAKLPISADIYNEAFMRDVNAS